MKEAEGDQREKCLSVGLPAKSCGHGCQQEPRLLSVEFLGQGYIKNRSYEDLLVFCELHSSGFVDGGVLYPER